MYQFLHPVLQVGPHIILLLGQVWEATQSAVFDLTLVIPVGDLAVGVVVVVLIKGVDLRKVVAHWSHVVGNHIDHNPDVFFVAGGDQIL